MQQFDEPTKLNLSQTDCALCGSNNVMTRTEEISFPYGSGDSAPILRAVVPIHTCRDCEIEFTNHDADVLCHDAVCRHLGIQTPSEIRAIRKKQDLTQSELSELTGIGIASINRWEKSGLTQSLAMDNFLFLLKIEGNSEALRKRRNQAKVDLSPEEKFPAIRLSISHLIHKQDAFAL